MLRGSAPRKMAPLAGEVALVRSLWCHLGAESIVSVNLPVGPPPVQPRIRQIILLVGAFFLLISPVAAVDASEAQLSSRIQPHGLDVGSVGSDVGTPKPRRARVRAPEDPENLYRRGLRQLRRGYYDEAIISFEKVKNHFPFNQYSVLSELRVADALFEKDSYIESIDAYRQFTRLHPRHSEIDYAIYRMARAEFKVASKVPQRDQSSTERGLKKLRGFERRFPDSEYVEEVLRIRTEARTRLAKRMLQVGNYYWKTREWKAAERRYGLVWLEYADTSVIFKARYRQALCLVELGRSEEAREVLEELSVREGSGRWGERARSFLDDNLTEPAVSPDQLPATDASAEEGPLPDQAKLSAGS